MTTATTEAKEEIEASDAEERTERAKPVHTLGVFLHKGTKSITDIAKRWVSLAPMSTCERTRLEWAYFDARGKVRAPATHHMNLHGEYDFAGEKLQDSVRLEVPKIRALAAV